MKRKTTLNQFILTFSSIIILLACSQTSQVSNNSLLQKRKYTKGFHFSGIKLNRSSNDKVAKHSSDVNEEINSNSTSIERDCEIIEKEISRKRTEPISDNVAEQITAHTDKEEGADKPDIIEDYVDENSPKSKNNFEKSKQPKSIKDDIDNHQKNGILSTIAAFFMALIFFVGSFLFAFGAGLGLVVITGLAYLLFIIGVIVAYFQYKKSKVLLDMVDTMYPNNESLEKVFKEIKVINNFLHKNTKLTLILFCSQIAIGLLVFILGAAGLFAMSQGLIFLVILISGAISIAFLISFLVSVFSSISLARNRKKLRTLLEKQ